MSIFTSKKVWKFLIKCQLTKYNPKRTRGWKVPSLMPIRVRIPWLNTRPPPLRFFDLPTVLYLYSIGKMLMCFCIPPWDSDGLKSHGAGKNRNKKKSRQIWTLKKRLFFLQMIRTWRKRPFLTVSTVTKILLIKSCGGLFCKCWNGKRYLFSNFSCMFLNTNNFFQFEL